MEPTKKRIGILDDIKGAAIIGVVLFHLGYDLVALFGWDSRILTNPLVTGLRLAAVAAFVAISGAVSHFSRSNLRRGIYCLLLAMGLTVFTAVFLPDELILFGILHLLGSSMILYALLGHWLRKIPPMVGIVVFVFLYFFTYSISSGYLGWQPYLALQIPEVITSQRWLFPLGILYDGFYSSDYYSILPWTFLFFAGSYLGAYLKDGKMPEWCYRTHSRFLSWCGQKTLWIYLIHQPVIYGAMLVLASVMQK